MTKVAFTPWDDGAHFITVSADKSLKIYNTETHELVMEQAGLHQMGINDLFFSQIANELITCSSDKTAKVWKVNFEDKKLEEIRTLELSQADADQIKDNVDKQQLGVILSES